MIHAALLLLIAAPEKPKLVVLELTPQSGVDAQFATTLTDAVTAEIAAKPFFQVTSAKDVQTMLGVERQRQLLGCSDQGACQTELAGAIGARYVLSGQVARVGESYQLTLQTLDSVKAVVVGRSIRFARDVGSLREALPYAVADATGTPAPAPPSRIVPYSLLGAGAAVLIGSGVLGLNAINQEAQVNSELSSGGQLRTLGYYYRAQDTTALQRSLSLAGLGLGAALLGAGLWLNPSYSGRPTVALGPGGASVGWAGSW